MLARERLAMGRLCLAILAATLWWGNALADAVYWNYGIASVQVGWDQQRDGPVGYKISFVGIGPNNASKKLADCIEGATIAAGEATQIPLDTRIFDKTQVAMGMVKRGETITKESLSAAFRAETKKTADLIAGVEQFYRYNVLSCMNWNSEAVESVQLGIVARLCVTWGPRGNPCKRARDPVGRAADPATGRYAKIYDWLMENKAQRPLDQIVQLVASGGNIRDINPDLRDRAYFPPPTNEEAQRLFEHGAERLRRRGWRYDYIAPKVASIDKTVAVSLVDTIANPAFVVSDLTDSKKKLLSASNELARTRLRECLIFRGNTDLQNAAECAGVKGNVEELAACLYGDRCAPELADFATRAALTIGQPMSLEDLAKGALLPRILGKTNFLEYQKKARTCAETSVDRGAFGKCLAKALMSEQTGLALRCIELNGAASAGNCISAVLPDGSETRAAKCVLDNKNDVAMAMCLAASTSPQAAEAYLCYQNHKSNANDAMACFGSSALPPQAKAAVACATQFKNDYQSIGACLVSKNIGGDAERLISCYASSKGNLVGAAACLAAGSLSAEQQIVLQCAAQTGMEPVSFGVCTGGMLAMKEFQQCRSKGFGEDNCFGENNEIRKFVRNIGLGDINGDTAVGQIANYHLQVLNITASAAEAIVAGIGNVAGSIGEGIGRLSEALPQTLNDLRNQGDKICGDICKEGEKICGDLCNGSLLSSQVNVGSASELQVGANVETSVSGFDEDQEVDLGVLLEALKQNQINTAQKIALQGSWLKALSDSADGSVQIHGRDVAIPVPLPTPTLEDLRAVGITGNWLDDIRAGGR